MKVRVRSPNVTYHENRIDAYYDYESVSVSAKADEIVAIPHKRRYQISTDTQVEKVGVLIVGVGGNNGSTLLSGILAHKHDMKWMTKSGEHSPNWFGSVCLASTTRLGFESGKPVFAALNELLPMLNPAHDVVIGGWDISGLNMADAMERAGVLDYDLQRRLKPLMSGVNVNGHTENPATPMPGVYFPSYIAMNQESRADNVLKGSKLDQFFQLRADIRRFKAFHKLRKVIVLWSATTEKLTAEVTGCNDTAENILKAISEDNEHVAPSTLYAVASIMERCTFINGSPQNTLVSGVVDLAMKFDVFVGGNDFKSGQTKLKSVLVDFLVSAGICPRSIVSYNHLGNNDGLNLSSPMQFKSKEITKSSVITDMIEGNRILYPPGTSHPDHTVVIKYVPYVGDSKRAMDEYTSEIFLGGHNTLVVHNTCEDSLLAAPLILDLILLAELCERIRISEIDSSGVLMTQPDSSTNETEQLESFIMAPKRKSGPYSVLRPTVAEPDAPPRMHCVLSILNYLCKAPMVPEGTPLVNALFSQREAIVNFLRACISLPPDNHMLLEYKTKQCVMPAINKVMTN